MMHGWGFGGGMLGLGFLGMGFQLLFWIGVIVLVIYLFRRAGSGFGVCRGMGQRDALEILRERYARGEISTEEFIQMKQELTR